MKKISFLHSIATLSRICRLSIVLLACLMSSGEAQNTNGKYDGVYYNDQYGYGFQIIGDQGICTVSNAPTYAVGDVMFKFTVDDNGRFQGQQIFTDGQWWDVWGQFHPDKIAMRAGVMIWWDMERINSTQAPLQSNAPSPATGSSSKNLAATSQTTSNILANLGLGPANPYHNGVDASFLGILSDLGLSTNFDVTDAAYPAGLGSGGSGGAGFIYPRQSPAYANGLQGECVALTRALTGVGPTDTWSPGDDVSLGTLTPGTPIATFTGTRYNNAHAAVFVSYVYSASGLPVGMYMLDQNNSPGTTKPAGIRYYLFGNTTYNAIQ